MKKNLSVAVGVFLVASLPASSSEAQIRSDLALELLAAVTDTAEVYSLRGVSAAVIVPGQGMWTGVFGMSDPETSLSSDMLISVASLTKTVTGALILQLADQGVLNLDDSIGNWLPELQNVPGNASIRQLLNHTSGIGNFGAHPELGPAISADRSKTWTQLEIARSFIPEPRFGVGEATFYSNSNMLLLGMIADSATGSTLAVEFRRRFWNRLGLEDVFLMSDEEPRGNLASSWVGPTIEELSSVGPLDSPFGRAVGWGAFGLKATPTDMAVWGEALMSGQLLSKNMTEQMLTAVAPPAGRNVALGTGVGLGLRRYSVAGVEVWGHSGVLGTATSLLIRDQATGVTVVTAINQSPRTQRNSHFRVAGALLKLANDFVDR